MKIRVVRTASKAQAVQVIRYQNNKRIILKHIGSASSEEQLVELMQLAHQWMKDYSEQLSIFQMRIPIKYYISTIVYFWV